MIHDSLGKVFSSVIDGIEFSEMPVRLRGEEKNSAGTADVE